MANPMQREARNSFILGILVAVVIMGIVVALLLVQLMQLKQAENERMASLVRVYILNQDVKSGETITSTMLTSADIESATAPSNVATIGLLTENTIAKIDLTRGTVVTQAMLSDSENPLTGDLRTQEYNMLQLPSQLGSGDYVDVRLRMPSGLDYIVVSKKEVEIPLIDGVESLNTIWLQLTEEEILSMSNAIVEAYQLEGSVLYTTKYVEPGTQIKATPTYVPSERVINLITQNPNIVNEAKTQMYNRYVNYTNIRNNINSELSSVDRDDATDNINSGVAQEVSRTQEQRQAYLDALSGR